MADDGMLLNFELPVGAFAAPTAKITGGTWKDRLTARKSAEYDRKKAQKASAAPNYEEKEPAEEEPPRPPKKRRTDNANGKSNNGEVISSLFTFNPTSRQLKEAAVEPEPSAAPSNAPLEDDETTRFTGLGLSPPLASHLLRKLGIKAPTAIQRRAVQQLCAHDTDAFVQAQTGSGKTLAYLLPIVQRITAISQQMKAAGQAFDRHSGLFAIILAPTRELSKQISVVLESLLSCCHWIVSGTVIGGEKKKSEKARLRKGVNILVATPGRLADHIDNTEVLDVSSVRWLVLDEGDRLMELGFEHDIQKLVAILNLRARKKPDKHIPGLPARRTTVLCSATLKADVEQLSKISLKDAVSISAHDAGEDGATAALVDNAFSAPAQLKQSYAIVPPKQRLVTLVALLKQTFQRKGSVMKCIVFMSCADSVDFHFDLLSRESGPVMDEALPSPPPSPQRRARESRDKPGRIPQGNSLVESRTQGLATFSPSSSPVHLFRLHGSLPQAIRTRTLHAFASASDPAVLVCTDVASRGLDLPSVDLVLEYDPPFSHDEHLHRIGRTARAGRPGRALIFLQPGCEEGYVDILQAAGRTSTGDTPISVRHLARHDAADLLRKGFSSSALSSSLPDLHLDEEDDGLSWPARATAFQLSAERSLLSNPSRLALARRAFQSHVRAYATHTAAERSIFDRKALHLGHLAKAFALRDRPGGIGMQGIGTKRPGEKDHGKTKKRSEAGSGKKRDRERADEDAGEPDLNDARKKMLAQARKNMTGGGEFNLG